MEGTFLMGLLQNLVLRQAKDNDQYYYFGPPQVNFRDALRMHNTLTGYVYLLDGVGKIRWCGSGEGTDEETANLTRMVQELLQDKTKKTNDGRQSKRTGRVRR